MYQLQGRTSFCINFLIFALVEFPPSAHMQSILVLPVIFIPSTTFGHFNTSLILQCHKISCHVLTSQDKLTLSVDIMSFTPFVTHCLLFTVFKQSLVHLYAENNPMFANQFIPSLLECHRGSISCGFFQRICSVDMTVRIRPSSV